MAQNILSSLFSRASLVIKEVSPTSSATKAKNLKVRSASIKMTSKVMRHMREDGTTIVDCRIILPTRIEIDVFCPTIDDVDQVNAILANRDSTYQINSRGVQGESYMLESQTLSQTPEVLSAAPVRLSFKELMAQDDNKPVTAQSADTSVIDQGYSNTNPITAAVKAVVDSKLGKAITGVFGG